MTNAQLQSMARTALNHWDFDNETDPDGAVMAGLEYIASDGVFDQDVIDANVTHDEDWDALQNWATRLGQQIVG